MASPTFVSDLKFIEAVYQSMICWINALLCKKPLNPATYVYGSQTKLLIVLFRFAIARQHLMRYANSLNTYRCMLHCRADIGHQYSLVVGLHDDNIATLACSA